MKTYRRYGYWLIFFCVPLILIQGCSNQLENNSEAKNSWFKYAKDDLTKLPQNTLNNMSDVLAKSGNVTALLMAGGATVAMNQGADDNAEGYFERHEVFHNFTDRSLKLLGGPGFHFAAAGLWYAISAENADEINRTRAWTMIEALSVTGITTVGLKAIRNDRTPAGNSWAWPSGHTSSSFTVAAVLDEFYGPKVGLCAYAAASLVGLRMIDQADHWASDVVFGATLGWIVGHSVAGKNKLPEIAGFKVLPYTLAEKRGVIGINLFRRF